MASERQINSLPGLLIIIIIIINIIIKIESAVQGRGRVRQKDKKSRLGQQESIGSALKTRQSHTIKYRVTKIIPKRR